MALVVGALSRQRRNILDRNGDEKRRHLAGGNRKEN
jgi:hypothetical protein